MALTINRRRDPNGYYRRLTPLKKMFWLYFLLLIFEGALRKWVAPQLSAPLLVVRDPVSIMIIWEAYRTRNWPMRWSAVASILTVGLVAVCIMQVVVGNNPWFVAVYGLRSYLLPFPVLFIMGENLDEEDLRKMGACILWLTMPMTLLQIAQYLSPSTAFLNKGAYEGAKQIAYTGGHVRAAGTFSFVVGSISFGTLAAAFVFYGLVKERFVKPWLLWGAAFAIVLSVPIIGARTLVVDLALVMLCVAIGALMGVSQFGKTLRVILPVLAALFLASQLPVFDQAMGNLQRRFREAANSEGGIQQTIENRSVGTIANAFEQNVFTSNWEGMGMGRGAAAMQTLLAGDQEMVAGEDPFSREVLEMGPIPGIAFEIFKLLLTTVLAGRALLRARDRHPLALLLLPLTVPALMMGVLEQPTEQGFMVLGGAFVLAAIRTSAPLPQIVSPPAFRSRVARVPVVRNLPGI